MCREVGGASAGTNAGTDRDTWAVAGGRSPNAAENGVSAGAGAVFAAATAASIDAAVPSVSVALATVAAVWHWATLIDSNAHGQMVTPAEPILALAVEIGTGTAIVLLLCDATYGDGGVVVPDKRCRVIN
eukprot:gene11481-608_t